MKNIAIQKNDAPVTFRNCPFRSVGREDCVGPKRSAQHITCEAGGGFELGTADCLDAVNSICAFCDIPPSLNLPHACLFLVPFRVFQHDQLQSYFGCRWYFSINPGNAPKNIDWCRGCRDWFPRPPEYLIPGQISISRKFHQIFLNPSERMDRLLMPPNSRKLNWREKLRYLFFW